MGSRAGKLRPSQAVTQNGPGALVDLPTLSMVMLTADLWEIGQARRVDEPRLARRLRGKVFRSPPFYNGKADTGGLPPPVFSQHPLLPYVGRPAPPDRVPFNRGKCGEPPHSPGLPAWRE